MIGSFWKALRGLAGQLVVGDIQENLFIAGFSFSWEDYLEYLADEEKIIVFDPTACSCAQIIFRPLIFAANAGPIKIDIYTEASYDAETGTLLGQSNRRETSSIPSEAILRLNPTNFSGTKFAGDLVPSNGAAAPNASGNSNQQGLPFEIDLTKIKAIGLTNTDGNGVLVSHKLTWFEVPAGF